MQNAMLSYITTAQFATELKLRLYLSNVRKLKYDFNLWQKGKRIPKLTAISSYCNFISIYLKQTEKN